MDPITALSTITIIVGKIADALLSKSVGYLVDVGNQRFSENTTQQVFKKALVASIYRYSTHGNRFALGEILLTNNSPLAQDDVAKEVSQILRFDREPNYHIIGEKWRATIQDPPAWRDFSFEAQLLIKILKEELQATEQFRPVFDSKNLNAINLDVEISTQSIINIEQDLRNLVALIDSHFGNIAKIFSTITPNIGEYIRDFSWLIEEKTRGFTGRRFVFENIKKFLSERSRGYFFIKGDPGIGKTALGAEYVKQTGCIHHFNSRSSGINHSDVFLRNICAQIIAKFNLDYSYLPADADKDSQFLIQLLNQASEKREKQEKIIIFVDALDEVEDGSLTQSANLLHLPSVLPNGVYIIVTTRRIDTQLRIECEQSTLSIDQDMSENITDIQEYLLGKLNENNIQNYLSSQSVSREIFIDYLTQKSQGNFMYLRYVLPEIESGGYKNTKLDALPDGLINYYEDHWHRMRVQSENAWFEYKLPVITALSIVPEPVSINLLSEFSQIKDLRRIYSVLNEWRQFLYEQKVEVENGMYKRWRVYHDSFREFIAQKDEVASEHINIKDAHNKIVSALWNGLLDDTAE